MLMLPTDWARCLHGAVGATPIARTPSLISLSFGTLDVCLCSDVVLEDAFSAWREDLSEHTPGKTKALVQVITVPHHSNALGRHEMLLCLPETDAATTVSSRSNNNRLSSRLGQCISRVPEDCSRGIRRRRRRLKWLLPFNVDSCATSTCDALRAAQQPVESH